MSPSDTQNVFIYVSLGRESVQFSGYLSAVEAARLATKSLGGFSHCPAGIAPRRICGWLPRLRYSPGAISWTNDAVPDDEGFPFETYHRPRGEHMVDPIRRKLLKTGAAAAAIAATPSVLAQPTGNRQSERFYEKGNVRIRYEEAGSGFPLLLIAGGGLNGSTIAGIRGGNPFNTIEAFKGEFRCIYADLRNSAGESTGPLEVDRPWDSYTDDHIGLMDHLGSSWCSASALRGPSSGTS
jgi:hypothetical protein